MCEACPVMVNHNESRAYPNEAAVERTLDARIQRRLATDAAYRNAENAHDQALREEAIEQEEIDRLAAEIYRQQQD